MATDAQTLLSEASCYQCFGPNEYTLTLIELALLRQILLASNSGATVDAQGLLDIAKCYECFAPNPYALQLMKLALLKQLAPT